MAKIRFTDEQIKELSSNPWVKSVTPKYISFTKEFMEEFVRLHGEGKSCAEIFESHGFPVAALGKGAVKSAGENWLRKDRRSIPLSDDKRGRPKTRDLTKDELIDRQRAQIEMLRQENEFLRQIRRLERRHQPSKSPSRKNSK